MCVSGVGVFLMPAVFSHQGRFFPENTSRRWHEEAAQVFQASAAAAGGGAAFIRLTKALPSLSERVCVCVSV